MNLSEKITSIFVGGALVGLFTALLVFGKISPAVYNTLVIAAMLLSIAIAALPRLQEFNLRDMKLLLAKAEKVTAELKEMYGDVEHLKVTPLRMDDAAYSELGLGDGGGLVHGSSVVNYAMGCMKRERERLARVFITRRSGDELARAVVDPCRRSESRHESI